MPGHTIGHSLLEQTKQNVNRLTELMTESDVIFLLMDSRESRWLPTLLGNYLDKVISVYGLTNLICVFFVLYLNSFNTFCKCLILNFVCNFNTGDY